MKNRFAINEPMGQSLIEVALVLPLLILLGFGVLEFSRMIYAKNTIINMSRECANLASRSTTPPQNIMNALASTAPQSVGMSSNGMIYITQVSGRADGKIEVVAQYKWLSAAVNPLPESKVLGTCTPYVNDTCTPNPRPLASLNALHLNLCDLGGSSCPPPNDVKTAYAAEVFDNYKPVFTKIGNINYSPQLYSITVF
jgi:TadE-like protein